MSPKDAQELALYRAVFGEIPDVIVLKDENGDFLLCNETVARLYNTTPDAMVGKHDGDFGVPPAMADAFRRNVLGIMARGETEIVFEDSRDAVSGEIRHFKSIKKPFTDARGRKQILVIAHDITDVVRAQARVASSERRLQEVMAATQEGIWDWQIATGEVIHNDQWYGILGFAAGEIADTVEAFAARIHPDDVASVMERIQRLVDGASPTYASEHRMLRKDGSVIWVQDRGRIAERDANGQPRRVVGAYVDITPRRQDQAALEEALTRAQDATRAKTSFLATMSHEIRTPMNGILGMAQLLLNGEVGERERQEYARTILNSGQTLLTLLNDILDFSKVEAGRLELIRTALDPRQLVRETVAIFEEPASSKGLQITTRFNGLRNRQYLGDPVRLRQMLSNYLSNAIKFARHGLIRIEVSELPGDPAEAATLEFSVSDDGIGISAEQQALLFKPFSQADSSTTRKYGGTGLGLSIVSSLAELMDGGVGVESEPGRGARFWFRIRIARRPDQTVAEGGDSESDADPAASDVPQVLNGRLLVAEDNALNRKVIGALLQKVGLDLHFVENGQLAVDALRAGMQPDLVLMDVQMPVMDGLTATLEIRRWESGQAASAEGPGQPFRHCPIVALTAGAFEEDRQRCLDAGMDDFLAKPINAAALIQTLGKWLAGPPPA